MRKKILLALLIIFYFSVATCMAYASNQAHALEKTTSNLDNQDSEKIFKAEEAALKKAKAERVRRERKQHLQETEETYEQALTLYHQKKGEEAKKAFLYVEDLMADYKLTGFYLKILDYQTALKEKHETHDLGAIQEEKQKLVKSHKSILRQIEEAKLLDDLSQRYTMLYQAYPDLGDNGNTVIVRKKMGKVNTVLRKLKEGKSKKLKGLYTELYMQEQLAKIAQKSDKLDQDVLNAIRAGDYATAKTKFDEFQKTMIDDLKNLKERVKSRDMKNHDRYDY